MDLKDIKGNGETSNSTQVSGSSSKQKKVGFLLGFGILIMPYFFSWFTLRKGHTPVSRAVAFIWLFFVVAIKFQGANGDRNVSSVGQPAQTAREAINEPCHKVSHKFGVSSNLSDVQKDELWKGYEGKTFKWKMTVSEVSNEIMGSGYTVQFKCQRSDAFVSDVIMNFPANQKNFIMGLQKGSLYEIEGVLKRYGSIIGLSADAI